MINNRVRYFTALTGAISSNMSMSKEEVLEASEGKLHKCLNWYNKSLDSYFYHPYVLYACPHYYKDPDFIKNKQISDDTHLFIDSGGFQKITGAIKDPNYNAELVYKWGRDNRANYLPVFDHPLRTHTVYNDHLKATVDNVYIYNELLKNDIMSGTHRDNFNVMNVIQGMTPDQIITWYEAVKKYKFMGWAHGGHYSYAKPIITGLIHLYKSGEFNTGKRVYYHAFGVASIDLMLYLAYIQRLFNLKGLDVQMSFDTSTATYHPTFGVTYCPSTFGMKKQIHFFLKNKELYKNIKDVEIFCDCPICTDAETMDVFLNSNSFNYYMILSLHNVYLFLRIRKMIDSVINLGIDQVIKDVFPSKYIKNFRLIEKAFEDDNHLEIIHRDFDETIKWNISDDFMDSEGEFLHGNNTFKHKVVDHMSLDDTSLF